MKYIVAVSGGIDSVVLLDMLVRSWNGVVDERYGLWNSVSRQDKAQTPPVVVAHFDHGIRPDSAEDLRFVAGLASSYRLTFVSAQEALGADASEELARERRYAFLESEAIRHQATIMTAHHGDDVIETVALNIKRGTGWRGLAVLDNPKVARPLLGLSKESIREYAIEHRLEWVEDSTNLSDAYLRNRLRRSIYKGLPTEKRQQVPELRLRQVGLKERIDTETARVLSGWSGSYSRYFFISIEPVVAIELLRALFVREIGHSLPRPQLRQVLLSIKVARPNTHVLVGGARVEFGVKTFTVTVKTPQNMLL